MRDTTGREALLLFLLALMFATAFAWVPVVERLGLEGRAAGAVVAAFMAAALAASASVAVLAALWLA